MSLVRKIAARFGAASSRQAPSSGRLARYRPQLEQLEAREVPAVLAVGTNLDQVVDYNPQWMFTDAFLSSRAWTSFAYNQATGVQAPDSTPIAVDANGWVAGLARTTNALGQVVQQRVGTVMLDGAGANGHYPAGTYRAEWDGTGTVRWFQDARVIEQGRTNSGANYALLQVAPSQYGVWMRIDETDLADPVRNVHLWMPDYGGQSFAGEVWRPGANFSPFHPLFLERLGPMNTIRFMQPGATVTSDVVHWEDRSQVTDARQATFATEFQDGLAAEYMVELANELNANPWFTMPHMADDDYVRNFATLVRDTLNPGLRVYVEWSNEAWNFAPGFETSRWLADQLARPENAGLNHYDIWAREARRDFAIWSEVFSGQTDHLVRVVAGQAANGALTDEVLRRMDGAFDAVSCDGYVGFSRTELAQFNTATTADQVTQSLFQYGLPRTLGFLRNHQALADQYSVALGRDIQLLVYEGGPLLFSAGQPYERAFLEAVRGPQMYDLYQQLLRGAADVGVDLFVHYVFTDASGLADASLLRWQDQLLSEAHRYRAVVDYIAAAHTAPALPVLAVTTPTPAVAEADNGRAIFTVSRTGPLDQSLTIRYGVGGTATAGNDYTALTGTVTMPAGANSADVTVTMLDDLLREDNETVTLTLLDNPAYEQGAQVSAAVTITDNDAGREHFLPVLMVIANQDFYYQEYADTRRELERAGFAVEVAAATLQRARPGVNSGQGADGGFVQPDLTLAEADAADYSAIVFVGGWGAAAYQSAFPGTYGSPAYNGSAQTHAAVNRLVSDFLAQDKYVTALCYGVSVLAWARVDGHSLLEGRSVAAYALGSPASVINGLSYAANQLPTRWHIETNGGAQFASRSLGDRNTAADDVWVDGRIITAENFDSARRFGQVVAEHLAATPTSRRPTNQAPANGVPVPQSVARGGSLVLSAAAGNAITVSDPDARDQNVRVSLTTTNGTLRLPSTSGLTAVVGNGAAAVMLTGSVTAVNAALDGLTFAPAAGFTGSALLQVLTDDLGNTGSGGPLQDTDSVAIQVVAPPTVQSVTVNDGHAQRSRVTSVTVSFDRPVVLEAGAFGLARLDGSEVTLDGYTPGTYSTVTLTFRGSLVEPGGSLADGTYALTVRANHIRDAALGQGLETNSVTMFSRRFGDSDGDGDVDRLDKQAFISAVGTRVGGPGYLWYFDFNGDGVIDVRDGREFLARLGYR